MSVGPACALRDPTSLLIFHGRAASRLTTLQGIEPSRFAAAVSPLRITVLLLVIAISAARSAAAEERLLPTDTKIDTAAATHQNEPSQPPCPLKQGALHSVSEVIDSETLRLDDGRVIRLIGALPPLPPGGADATNWPPTEAAKRALADLVLGRSVRLYHPSSSRDRYGHTLAHVVLADQPAFDGKGRTGGIWVQGWLIANGHALAYMLPGNADCASALAALEAQARQARRGLWAIAAYQPLPAWSTRRIRRLVGSFGLIEGLVRSVRFSHGSIYLNFGRSGRSAFSVLIGRDALREQQHWPNMLRALQGRRVLVRGWIELRNGPLIEVTDPSQIEVLEGV